MTRYYPGLVVAILVLEIIDLLFSAGIVHRG